MCSDAIARRRGGLRSAPKGVLPERDPPSVGATTTDADKQIYVCDSSVLVDCAGKGLEGAAWATKWVDRWKARFMWCRRLLSSWGVSLDESPILTASTLFSGIGAPEMAMHAISSVAGKSVYRAVGGCELNAAARKVLMTTWDRCHWHQNILVLVPPGFKHDVIDSDLSPDDTIALTVL